MLDAPCSERPVSHGYRLFLGIPFPLLITADMIRYHYIIISFIVRKTSFCRSIIQQKPRKHSFPGSGDKSYVRSTLTGARNTVRDVLPQLREDAEVAVQGLRQCRDSVVQDLPVLFFLPAEIEDLNSMHPGGAAL